ncbi:hypothetical protein HUG15_06750 [Salicibibacter cibarius]|uniref:ABC transporter permease n=1 Tax=Salicibibacter cibarius TaxID=2743000 RepID=A0A7T7CAY1_9BACI|nr:hypothetical protein [Salicibibacter cibarius]QQK75318.1 hypothetical protein HUG15_06750 [Salicibibacter cibarius]
MKLKQLKALLYKETANLRYNGQFFVMIILLLFFYAILSLEPYPSWMFLVVLTLIMLPLQMQGLLLAEEKEQQTWRILKEQGVYLYGIALVKAMPLFVITCVFVFFISIFSGLGFVTSLFVCIFITPALLVMLSIGTIVASYATDKIEVGIWEGPIIIIFIALEIMREFLPRDASFTPLGLLPNYQFYEGLTLITHQPTEAFLSHFIYFLLWAAGFVFLAAYVLHKRKHTF